VGEGKQKGEGSLVMPSNKWKLLCFSRSFLVPGAIFWVIFVVVLRIKNYCLAAGCIEFGLCFVFHIKGITMFRHLNVKA